LDRPGLRGVAPEEAEALEAGEVGVDGARAREPDRLADLPHARGVAPVAEGRLDEVEDLSLLAAERGAGVGHRWRSPCVERAFLCCTVLMFGRRGKHLFERPVDTNACLGVGWCDGNRRSVWSEVLEERSRWAQ